MKSPYDGLGSGMSNLALLSNAKSRSISPENFTGEKGKAGMATEGTGAVAARDLGIGWKISPSVRIESGETFVMADIEGSGAIQHIWLTPKARGNANRSDTGGYQGQFRHQILRIYWDDQEQPAVECPIGDFFAAASADREYMPLSSLAVCANPRTGLNCYWEMPFSRRARMTVTNINPDPTVLYYQVDYTLTDVPEHAARFHAQFRRSNPVPYGSVHTILDGVKGHGHYVGTYIFWGVNNAGWWGEGEVKFFIDGDKEFPTIAGTGTEDYFCGSYDFESGDGTEVRYTHFTTPYAGLSYFSKPDGLYRSQQRFGMYRWHITDPVRFEQDLAVTIQALGWRGDRRYLPLQDDVASVAFWYQTLPTGPFPELPDRDQLEII